MTEYKIAPAICYYEIGYRTHEMEISLTHLIDIVNKYSSSLLKKRSKISISNVDSQILIYNLINIKAKLEEISELLPEVKNFLPYNETWRYINKTLIKEHDDTDVLRDFYFDNLRTLKNYIETFIENYYFHLIDLSKLAKLPSIEKIPSALSSDLFEIRNLVSEGYDRTAVLVVGRTIEDIFRKIGNKRKIRKVEINHGSSKKTKKWDKLTFSEMNITLNNVPLKNKGRHILSKTMKSQIEPIIQYRNMGAHPIEPDTLSEIEDNTIHFVNIGINSILNLYKTLEGIPKSNRVINPKIQIHT